MPQLLDKDVESILTHPLTAIRTRVAKGLLEKNFTDQERNKELDELENAIPANLKSSYQQEKKKIEQTLASGKLTAQPDLSSPELQLLWAINLVPLAVNNNPPIHQTPLWRQLLQCDDAKSELRNHAFYIARDAINPDTKLKWGIPGSMFYSDPTNNQINIDFLMSLVGGMEETRSIIFHEIGHSKLTRGYPKRMTEVREQMEQLAKKANSGQITQDEYAEMQGLNTEWQLRNAIFQEGENCPVNRYALNVGARVDQMMPEEDKMNMDHALNNVETTIAEAGTYPLPDQDTPMARFQNLARAVRMSLYKNNGLFADDAKGWERIGVRPDWIQALPKSKKGKLLPAKESFEELLELCGNHDGLEHLQPTTVDGMKGVAWLDSVTSEKAAQRNAIMEDEIWDRYAEPLVRPLIEQAKEQAREQMKQQSNGKEDQNQQSQNDQGQQGKSGQSQDEQSSGNDQGGKSQGDEKSKEGQEAGGGNSEESKGKATDSDKEENQGQGAGVDGEEKDISEPKQEGNGAARGADSSDDGKESPAAGDTDEGQSIASLLQELDNAERGKLDTSDPQELEEGGEEIDAPSSSGRGAGSSSVSTKPRVGDWSDYQSAVTLFGAEIRQARKLLVQIQEKQAKTTHHPTYRRSILPDDGDMSRFDEESHEALVTKLLTGQAIGEHDASRFVVDEEKKTPASIDVVIGIDGSGSMYWDHSSDYSEQWSHSPIQAGINIACILNEAAKKPRNHRNKEDESDIHVWGMAWGNNPPSMIMKPGDDPVDVGQAIDGLKHSRGWGTDLSPAVKHITKTLAEHKGNPRTPVGAAHNIIISDGDIADPKAAAVSISKLLDGNRQTTFDVVVIQKGKTEMDDVVEALQKKHGEARVKLVHCDSPDQAQSSILMLLRERMLATGHSKAIPHQQRQRDFQKTYENMR